MASITSLQLARAGATAYVIWGLMHLGLGLSMTVSGIATPRPWSETQSESLMFFLCATVLGLLCVLIAFLLNWKNSRTGFLLNLVLTVPVDAALLLVLIPPGHVDLIGGLAGPAVMVVAIILSSAALLARRREHASGGGDTALIGSVALHNR